MTIETSTKPYNFWFREKKNGYVEGPRIFNWILTCIITFITLFFLLGLVFSWPFQQTPRDKIGLSYGGGIIEGAHYQKTVSPGHGLFFNGFADRLYLYHVTQRNYIISKHPEEGDRKDADFIEAVTSDNVRMQYETFTGMLLNTDEIRKFHETLGLKFKAWTNDGWDKLLDQTIRQVQENALQDLTRNYSAQDLRSSPGTLTNIQQAVSKKLNENIIGVLGGNYFCNTDWKPGTHCGDMKFIIKRVTVPAEIAVAYERNAQSLIDVQTAANKVKQAEQQRQEIEKLTEALSRSGGQYPLLKAIESGQVKFWVLPDNKGITLQTPVP